MGGKIDGGALVSLGVNSDGNGMVTTDFSMGSRDVGAAAVIQPDGKILVAGYSGFFPSYDFALARYNADGSLDTSFDGDGLVTTDFSMGSDDVGIAVVLQSDSKILVAGYSNRSGSPDFALARYNIDGSLDSSFAGDGLLTTDFPIGESDVGAGIAIQSDGKIVVTGRSDGSGSGDFALARYNNSIAGAVAAAEIPTLSIWAIAFMALLLTLVAMIKLQRLRHSLTRPLS